MQRPTLWRILAVGVIAIFAVIVILSDIPEIAKKVRGG
jgi:hypothetical protein